MTVDGAVAGRRSGAEPAARTAEPQSRRGSLVAVAVVAVLLLGLGLRTVQLVAQVDLWHDELAVARNVEDRDLAGLVGSPLDHQQVAPAGFLALVELSTRIFGVTTFGLRFVPWLLGIAAMLLFWRVARRFTAGWARVAVLALFAVSPALVWYGSSVKPYGGDVAVGLLLVWLALRLAERPDDLRRGAVAGLAGGAALLVSFPAVPTAALLGAMLVVLVWRRRPRPSVAPLAVLGFGWAAGAALATWSALSLLDPGTDDFMRGFWQDDFPPLDPPWAALVWTGQRLYGVFAHSIAFIVPKAPALVAVLLVLMALAAVGLVLAVRRGGAGAGVDGSQRLVVLLLAPPLAALAAAFAHLLPFDNRLGLHAAWPILVLAGAGLTGLEHRAPGRWRLLPRGLALLLAVAPVAGVLLAAPPPYPGERGTRPRMVLEELSRRLEPGDRLYVYTQGRHDAAFYGRRAGIDRWIQGERHYDEPRDYLREADALRGSARAWFFWVRLGRDEPAWIRDYLSTVGRELDRIESRDFTATGAVLYDLSDPTRLDAASAETFPTPEGSGPGGG